MGWLQKRMVNLCGGLLGSDRWWIFTFCLARPRTAPSRDGESSDRVTDISQDADDDNKSRDPCDADLVDTASVASSGACALDFRSRDVTSNHVGDGEAAADLSFVCEPSSGAVVGLTPVDVERTPASRLQHDDALQRGAVSLLSFVYGRPTSHTSESLSALGGVTSVRYSRSSASAGTVNHIDQLDDSNAWSLVNGSAALCDAGAAGFATTVTAATPSGTSLNHAAAEMQLNAADRNATYRPCEETTAASELSTLISVETAERGGELQNSIDVVQLTASNPASADLNHGTQTPDELANADAVACDLSTDDERPSYERQTLVSTTQFTIGEQQRRNEGAGISSLKLPYADSATEQQHCLTNGWSMAEALQLADTSDCKSVANHDEHVAVATEATVSEAASPALDVRVGQSADELDDIQTVAGVTPAAQAAIDSNDVKRTTAENLELAKSASVTLADENDSVWQEHCNGDMDVDERCSVCTSHQELEPDSEHPAAWNVCPADSLCCDINSNTTTTTAAAAVAVASCSDVSSSPDWDELTTWREMDDCRRLAEQLSDAWKDGEHPTNSPTFTSSLTVPIQDLYDDTGDFLDSDEWLYDEYVITSPTMSSSSHDVVKPPPPYATVSTASDFVMTADGIIQPVSPAARRVAPTSAVSQSRHSVQSVVAAAVDVFWQRRRYGESWDDVAPPESFLDSTADPGCTATDLAATSRRAHRRLLFDLVAEILRDVYHDDDAAAATADNCWSPAAADEPWTPRRGTPRRRTHRFVVVPPMPTTVDRLRPVVERHVLACVGLARADELAAPPSGARKRGVERRQRDDAVDRMLVEELCAEEPGWTDYDVDVTTRKLQLTEIIFDTLLSDTLYSVDDACRRRRHALTSLSSLV